MKSIILVLLFSSATCVKAQDKSIISATQKENNIYELRIYEIFDSNKKAFHDRFREHALPIMKKYGFNISSIWESKFDGKTEFIYLLEWPDEFAMKKAWELFRADKDWIAIKKQTSAKFGDLLGNIEDRVLIKTNYSPN